MKKALLSIAGILLVLGCAAQAQLAFPFQGGKDVMTKFFKDNLKVSPDIIQRRATGTVIFKFTADEKGKVTKVIIYFADDAVLVPPIIDALKKSNHKWIIPDHERFNDFILPVSYSFNRPVTETDTLKKTVYDFNQSRKPIFSTDQIPLDLATLLPAVKVSYNIAE